MTARAVRNPPPIVVALVTQKGGAGKTTLAANLAVAATEAGETVVMYDLDPQASLLAWARDRVAKEIEDIDVIEAKSFQGSQIDELRDMELNGKAISLVILDCPGVNSTSTNNAIRQASFCLLPARPSWLDIQASRPTVQALLSLKRPFAFALNQCQPGRITNRTNEGQDALKLMGGLAEPAIGERIDFQDAMREGLGVTEHAPEGRAAEEIRRLWLWVKAHTAKDPQHSGVAAETQDKGQASTSKNKVFGVKLREKPPQREEKKLHANPEKVTGGKNFTATGRFPKTEDFGFSKNRKPR